MINIKTIAVHNGNFHSDDVFSIAILKIIYPNINVIRTRDEELLRKADLRIDVGRKYNPEMGDFDHHQLDFKEKRKNNIPYASAGLIWKHFASEIIEEKWIIDYLDKRIFQYIDADDNGKELIELNINIYDIADIIDALNPNEEDEKTKYNDYFFKAVDFAVLLVKSEIKRAKRIYDSRKELLTLVKNSKNKDYVVIEENIAWYETAITDTDLKFVVVESSSGGWGVSAVPKRFGRYENRMDLPAEWAGKSGKELANITGVDDAIFCHKARFTAVAKTKEGAIKLVELALNKDDKAS